MRKKKNEIYHKSLSAVVIFSSVENFMTGYRMVFDREKLKLGWSSSNCEYSCFYN